MPSISNCQSPNTHWCTTSQRAWRPRKIQLPLFANQHPLLYNWPYWTASFLQLATLTGIVHLNEHRGQELQVLHAARAQRHQEVKRCDHSQGRGTHGHHLLGWELALGLPALEHNFGRRENEVFHQFLKSQKTPTSETDWAHASNWMEISTLSLSTKLISHTYKSVKANEHSYTSPWGPESRDHKLSEQNVNFTQPGTHFFLMSTSLSHIMKQEILLFLKRVEYLFLRWHLQSHYEMGYTKVVHSPVSAIPRRGCSRFWSWGIGYRCTTQKTFLNVMLCKHTLPLLWPAVTK